jgi:uncharacterized membrane protein YgcG
VGCMARQGGTHAVGAGRHRGRCARTCDCGPTGVVDCRRDGPRAVAHRVTRRGADPARAPHRVSSARVFLPPRCRYGAPTLRGLRCRVATEAGTRDPDAAYCAALEQRLLFACANAAKLPPAFRLLHDYALLANAAGARSRAGTRTDVGLPGSDGSNSAPLARVPSPPMVAPLPSYLPGRLPSSDPWMEDHPSPTPSDASGGGGGGAGGPGGSGGGSGGTSGAAGGGGAGEGGRNVLSMAAGLIYSSAAMYFSGAGAAAAAPEAPATPVFVPNEMVIETSEEEEDGLAIVLSAPPEASAAAPAPTIITNEATAAPALANEPGAAVAAPAKGTGRDHGGGAAEEEEDDDDDLEIVQAPVDYDTARVRSIGIEPVGRRCTKAMRGDAHGGPAAVQARADVDLNSEWERLGLTVLPWRVSSVNEQYHMCSTYPTRLPVPASVCASVWAATLSVVCARTC